MSDLQEQIRSIEEQITELKASWPAHSPQPWMLQKLEELEEELETLQEKEHNSE
jgi:hypothetical protein